MKYFSPVLGKYIDVIDRTDESLNFYSKKEIDFIKLLRKSTKNDNKFACSMRIIDELKTRVGITIKDWSIPWDIGSEDHQKTTEKKASVQDSFWTQIQQENSRNIVKQIKLKTKAGKSAQRLKDMLSPDEKRDYKV